MPFFKKDGMDKTIATVAVEIYQAYKALYFGKRKDSERFGAYRRKQKPRKAFIVFEAAETPKTILSMTVKIHTQDFIFVLLF